VRDDAKILRDNGNFFIFSSDMETTEMLGNVRETLGYDESVGQCMSRKHYERLSSIKKPSMECWFFFFEQQGTLRNHQGTTRPL
jgi:hypothetical protein